MLPDIVGEEKQLEHGKNNKKLDEDDSPKRPPQCHTAEAIIIQMVNLIEKTIFAHRYHAHFSWCKDMELISNMQILFRFSLIIAKYKAAMM
jgi:hypothetical protein